VWRQAGKNGLPRLVYVNKMDREGADLNRAVETVRDRLQTVPLLCQYPLLDSNRKLRGFVDLLTLNVTEYLDSDPQGTHPKIYPLHTVSDKELHTEVRKAREQFVETVADFSEPIMTKYLEGVPLSESELKSASRVLFLQKAFTPILCGASLRNRGVQALLDAMVDYMPSPLEQSNINAKRSDGSVELLKPDSNSTKAAALAFKVTHDKHMGSLVFFRVYSGNFPVRHGLYNVTQRHKEFPQKFLRIFADEVQEVSEASFGGVYCATGLKGTKTGDTLTLASQHFHVELESIVIPEPVFFVAIEAETSQDEERLTEVLDTMLREDPSLSLRTNSETGQTLLGGMGELHLDIVQNRLQREYQVDLRMGKPRVAYREIVQKRHTADAHYDHTFGGQRIQALLRIQVEPRSGVTSNYCNFSPGATQGFTEEQVEALREGAQSAFDAGPELGLPMISTSVQMLSLEDLKDRNLAPSALQAISAAGTRYALRSAGTSIVEPIMSVEIVVPERHMADVISDLSRRRGTIESVDVSGPPTYRIATITSLAPLQGMIGYSTSLRSATQGSASFSQQFSHYDIPTDGHESEILKEVRGY